MRALTIAVGITTLFLIAPTARAVDPIRVTPKEIPDLLPNPGMGWQTFHHYADEDKNLAGLPSTSCYIRFYWSDLETDQGEIKFEHFDTILARAKKAHQKLAFRVMCVGTDDRYMHVPAYLKNNGCKGYEFQHDKKGPTHWAPDFDDPIFAKAHARLIAELGKRYDNHPDVDLLDIGSVGLWGEWHMSGTGVKLPPPQTRAKIIDLWCDAFPNTPKAMLIGDADGMKHAFTRGAGWRADCIGDLGGFSKTWNHMKNLYPQQLEKTDARDIWKTAPVAYESCWDMRKWKAEGWDIRAIFDFALETHASYLNNKSTPIPDGARPEVERLLRKLGYRLVLRQLEHPAEAKPGADLALTTSWDNVGVAPPYRDYLLALRLESTNKPTTIVSQQSIKGWLPGPRTITTKFPLPPNLPPGNYTLSLTLVDPKTNTPAIHLAIAGRDDTGWYPQSRITIK